MGGKYTPPAPLWKILIAGLVWSLLVVLFLPIWLPVYLFNWADDTLDRRFGRWD